MKTSHAAILAMATFALGIIAGRLERVSNSVTTVDVSPSSPAATMAALPAGHPTASAAGSLEEAIHNTVRASSAPAAAPGITPSATEMLVAQAETQRRQRKFAEAADTYRKLIAQHAMNADRWADYADALASAASSLRGEPARALDRALELDARHPKALWLKASLEHEEQRYADAAKTWTTLLAVVPADSSDAKIIRANIDEASRLARGRS